MLQPSSEITCADGQNRTITVLLLKTGILVLNRQLRGGVTKTTRTQRGQHSALFKGNTQPGRRACSAWREQPLGAAFVCTFTGDLQSDCTSKRNGRGKTGLCLIPQKKENWRSSVSLESLSSRRTRLWLGRSCNWKSNGKRPSARTRGRKGTYEAQTSDVSVLTGCTGTRKEWIRFLLKYCILP